jgi:superfamily I DNA and/or RNA helicase
MLNGGAVVVVVVVVAAAAAAAVAVVRYRMHPAISTFASDCFYGGRIRDGVSARDRPVPRGFDWPRRDFPVAFVDVPHGREEGDGSSSKANAAEAAVVMQVVVRLVRDGRVAPAEVGIVTPYAAQVRALRRLRDREGLREVECASVDGFQGREKEVRVTCDRLTNEV